VRFRRHKKDQIAKAHREVIVSAGAIASPQILMLSGIGPADHLRYHGIPVRADLPVGKSLQSHVGTGEVVFSVKKKVSYDPRRYLTNPGVNVIKYFIFITVNWHNDAGVLVPCKPFLAQPNTYTFIAHYCAALLNEVILKTVDLVEKL
jgi:hypothetical protein